MLMGMVYIDLEIWGSIELKSGKRNGIKWACGLQEVCRNLLFVVSKSDLNGN